MFLIVFTKYYHWKPLYRLLIHFFDCKVPSSELIFSWSGMDLNSWFSIRLQKENETLTCLGLTCERGQEQKYILALWKFLKNSFKNSLLAQCIIPCKELQGNRLFHIHCTGPRKERRCIRKMFGNLHGRKRINHNGNKDSIWWWIWVTQGGDEPIPRGCTWEPMN